MNFFSINIDYCILFLKPHSSISLNIIETRAVSYILKKNRKYAQEAKRKEKGSFIYMKIDKNYCNEVSELVHEFEKN